MKGVSREVITTVIMLIVVTLFLVSIIVIFREQLESFVQSLRDVFRNLLKVS